MPTLERRQLDFRCGADVISEIESLRSAGYTKTKNWNLSQICEHLNMTMVGGMDGFGFRLPWILRSTVVKWAFGRALKNRKLPGGAPTFSSLKPKPASADDDAKIDECIATIQRAEQFNGSMENYALLDNLSVADWQAFMWIHAAHHLGYLLPNAEVESIGATNAREPSEESGVVG